MGSSPGFGYFIVLAIMTLPGLVGIYWKGSCFVGGKIGIIITNIITSYFSYSVGQGFFDGDSDSKKISSIILLALAIGAGATVISNRISNDRNRAA